MKVKTRTVLNQAICKISNTTVSKFITVEDYHTIELVVVGRKQTGTEVASSQQQIRYRPNISDVNSATSFYRKTFYAVVIVKSSGHSDYVVMN